MNAVRPIQKYWLYHLLGWIILFLGWYFFRFDNYPPAVAGEITGVKVAGLAVLVYLTNYGLIPRLLYKRRYALFALIYLPMIFCMGLLKMYIIERLIRPYSPGFSMFSDLKGRIYDNIIPSFFLTSTFAAGRLLFDYWTTQQRLSDISREKAETELKFLKSQINPHFLFNSLNSIYFLIDKQNADARQTLLRFSDLLRYQLYDCNADTIGIEREIVYLKDYIRLQQIRKDEQYETKVEIGDIQGFRIVPLLLIPFVENAFKHVSHHSDGRRNFVQVELARTGNILYFHVENSKEEDRSSGVSGTSGASGVSGAPEGGIGLANVRRRLELLYPGRHHLQIENNAATFKVALELNIP